MSIERQVIGEQREISTDQIIYSLKCLVMSV